MYSSWADTLPNRTLFMYLRKIQKGIFKLWERINEILIKAVVGYWYQSVSTIHLASFFHLWSFKVACTGRNLKSLSWISLPCIVALFFILLCDFLLLQGNPVPFVQSWPSLLSLLILWIHQTFSPSCSHIFFRAGMIFFSNTTPRMIVSDSSLKAKDTQKIGTDFIWCEHLNSNFDTTKGYLETILERIMIIVT